MSEKDNTGKIKSAERCSENLTFRYALIHCCLWMGYAAIIGFASVYLLDIGFSNSEIGVISAAAGAISAVMQPAVATFADKPSSPSLKKVLLGLSFLLLVLSVLVFISRGTILFTWLFFGMCIMFLMILTPLVNSLGAESLNQGKSLNFGVSRGIGSIAYGTAAYILGYFADSIGAVIVPVSMIFIFVGFIAALLWFPFEKTEKSAPAAVQSGGGLISFCRRYRRFAVVLFGCIFLYTSHILINCFTFQIVESKGGGSAELGAAMALCACVELPTMFLFSFMAKKVRCDFWFRLSGVFFMLKSLGTLLVTTIAGFYCIQILQMFGWALISVASVYYVNSLMEKQDVIKGQAYMTTTYTIGVVFGSLFGGSVIDLFGVNTMLLWATIFGFLGMVIVLIAARETGKRAEEKT